MSDIIFVFAIVAFVIKAYLAWCLLLLGGQILHDSPHILWIIPTAIIAIGCIAIYGTDALIIEAFMAITLPLCLKAVSFFSGKTLFGRHP